MEGETQWPGRSCKGHEDMLKQRLSEDNWRELRTMLSFPMLCTDCALQKFCKEVVTWKTLQHPNVLLLIGVTMSETQFAMISDWMENGNINEFVKTHPDANRLDLVDISFEVSLPSLHVNW